MTRYLILIGSVIVIGLIFIWYMNPNRVVAILLNDATEVKIIDVNKSIEEQKEVVAAILHNQSDIELLRPMLECKMFGWTDMKVCSCAGNARLEFYNGTTLIGKIGVQHNKALRLKGVSSDCDLVETEKKALTQYIKGIGIVGEYIGLTRR